MVPDKISTANIVCGRLEFLFCENSNKYILAERRPHRYNGIHEEGIGTGFLFSSLYSGSSGNASFAAVGQSRILIDAGVSAVRIQQALHAVGSDIRQIDGVLITHEHIDHIKSAGTLARRHDLCIYANAATWKAIDASGKIGNIPCRNRAVFDTGHDFFIGSMGVTSFPVAHDTADPVGFMLWGQGKQVAVATDMGHMTATVLGWLREADAVLLESNHDVDMLKSGRYPPYIKQRILGRRGHLSNEAAAAALIDLLHHGVDRVALAHLSRDNNTPEVAYHTITEALGTVDAQIGRDIDITMTWPDRPGASWAL